MKGFRKINKLKRKKISNHEKKTKQNNKRRVSSTIAIFPTLKTLLLSLHFGRKFQNRSTKTEKPHSYYSSSYNMPLLIVTSVFQLKPKILTLLGGEFLLPKKITFWASEKRNLFADWQKAGFVCKKAQSYINA